MRSERIWIQRTAKIRLDVRRIGGKQLPDNLVNALEVFNRGLGAVVRRNLHRNIAICVFAMDTEPVRDAFDILSIAQIVHRRRRRDSSDRILVRSRRI